MSEGLDPAQNFKKELVKEIRKRRKYEYWDFRWAHIFLWLSILASFTSAIIVAAGDIKIPKVCVAIIAGIPGLVVVIDKSFDFAKRAAWDTMYKIEMQELKDDMDFGRIDPYEAAKKLREISRKHEAAYLKIGFLSKEINDTPVTNAETPPVAQSGQLNNESNGAVS